MIKLFVSDIDGTMTDGGVYQDKDGNELVKYNKLDGEGIKTLKEHKIIPIMISNEENFLVHSRRAWKLKCTFLTATKVSKKDLIEEYIKNNNISWDEVAYIGDDISDIECMEKAFLSFCPKNSFIMEKGFDFFPFLITRRQGGEGAVREAANYIIEYNKENS